MTRKNARLRPTMTQAEFDNGYWYATGRPITYRDLVLKAIELNKTKRGPLRLEHGRYINFLSDFSAAQKGASREEALRAWRELKAMNAPKTYESWANARKARTRTAR